MPICMYFSMFVYVYCWAVACSYLFESLIKTLSRKFCLNCLAQIVLQDIFFLFPQFKFISHPYLLFCLHAFAFLSFECSNQTLSCLGSRCLQLLFISVTTCKPLWWELHHRVHTQFMLHTTLYYLYISNTWLVLGGSQVVSI